MILCKLMATQLWHFFNLTIQSNATIEVIAWPVMHVIYSLQTHIMVPPLAMTGRVGKLVTDVNILQTEY